MQIRLNGKITSIRCNTLAELKGQYGKEEDIVILNGFSVPIEELLSGIRTLHEMDEVFFIHRGVMPGQEELEAMMASRHTPGVWEKVNNARVAVAGLGGLGSHIAVMLARTGVGKLLLVDFDVVEPSNLNRQNYLVSHLGKKKTEALKEQIAQINPFIQVETIDRRVTAENAAAIFGEYPIICEAFDRPEAKAALVNAVLMELPESRIVSASGMAGYDSANDIKTVRKMSRLYVCGDMENEAKEGRGLMAPRVQVCAGHQANMVLRLILGITEV